MAFDPRNDGAAISCGTCREVVYPNARVMANHDITFLPDGRARWFSREFKRVVHLCGEDTTVVAEAERLLEVAARSI